MPTPWRIASKHEVAGSPECDASACQQAAPSSRSHPRLPILTESGDRRVGYPGAVASRRDAGQCPAERRQAAARLFSGHRAAQWSADGVPGHGNSGTGHGSRLDSRDTAHGGQQQGDYGRAANGNTNPAAGRSAGSAHRHATAPGDRAGHCHPNQHATATGPTRRPERFQAQPTQLSSIPRYVAEPASDLSLHQLVVDTRCPVGSPSEPGCSSDFRSGRRDWRNHAGRSVGHDRLRGQHGAGRRVDRRRIDG